MDNHDRPPEADPSSVAVPDVPELMRRIIASGSGMYEFFLYETIPDGLYLQQDPKEFAEFVHYMATEVRTSELSIDIGVASGGQTKFLRDYFSCKKTITVDIGQHPDAVHWSRIRTQVKSNLILEIIDDSHAPRVREALLPYKGRIDFAYIDGDHSYAGLRQDLFLARELLAAGAHVALHDTLGVEDCARVHEDLRHSANFEHVADFNSRFGISLWRLRAPMGSTEGNRLSGEGDL